MEFGMPFLLETETLEECVQLCSRLGLSFVEWNMNFPQCQLERLDADKLNRLGRELGIYYTLHLDENLNVSDFNAKVRQAYLDTVLESIELAQKIGAPIINMHDAKGSRPHLALRDGEIDLCGKMQLARDAGVRVVLETKTVEALTKSVGIAAEILRDCAMNVKK